MRSQIRHLLLDSVNKEDALHELETSFYENLKENAKQEPILMDRLLAYPTVEAFLREDDENLSYDLSILLTNILDDLDYLLMLRFDQIEDGVKAEMIHGNLTKGVLADMQKSGIVRLSKDPLTEDEVEEFYMDLFLELDQKRQAFYDEAMRAKPQDFYEAGQKNVEAYKEKHHLLMDDYDFTERFRELFNERAFTAMVARKVYELIRYHSRYELEELEDGEAEAEEDPEEDFLQNSDLEDVPARPQEAEALLVPCGDLKAEDYERVYDLLYEYNGRRVLPTDEGGQEEAYWGTFSDDFQDLLNDYFTEVLEQTLQYFIKEKPQEYASFARFYHLSEEDRKDPVKLIEASDDLNMRLSMIRDELWENLTEAPVMPLYSMGETLVKRMEPDPEEVKSFDRAEEEKAFEALQRKLDT